MKEDLNIINELLWKMNFPINRIEKEDYFGLSKFENEIKDIDKGYKMIQKSCNNILEKMKGNIND